MENERVLMPDGTEMTFEECLDNIQNTRDMSIYLDSLLALKDNLIIILSVKDSVGKCMPNAIFEKIHHLGLNNYSNSYSKAYIGVIDCGNVVFDKTGETDDETVVFECEMHERNFFISSGSFVGSNVSKTVINDIDCSMNGRGCNFVIVDRRNNEVIDSCTYDSFVKKPTFFHKNFSLNNSFCDRHFFAPEKYKKNWIEPYRKSYFSNKKLSVIEVENGIILPNKFIDNKFYGGVCDKDFNFISGHKTIDESGGYWSRHIFGGYKVAENELDYIDETVVYGGTFINHIGHLLTESFANRIWWFIKHPDSNYKIAAPIIWGGSDAAFVIEMLEIFGIEKSRLIKVEKATKFKKVIIPDECMLQQLKYYNYYYTNEASEVFKKISSNVMPSNLKKIYFTKRKMAKGNMVGESFFIDFFEKKGFEIIDPEDYSLKEKIGFIRGADEFVTTAGTNVLYAIFSKPNAKITILSRTNDTPPSADAPLFELAKINNFFYVNVSIEFLHKDFVSGLSFIGVTDEFRQYVKSVYNENLNISPEEYLKEHVYEYLQYFTIYYNKKFDCIKNQKMISILQMMSEVFCGKDFDTTGLNLTTNEDNLRVQVKQLTTDLDKFKKRTAELESTDVYKAAKLLDETNSKLEKQVLELKEALTNMHNLQNKVDELTTKNAELEKTLLNTKHAAENLDKDYKRLKEKTEDISLQLKNAQLENKAAMSENSELQDRINGYESSRSWRITKPLRLIAWFFRRLFGGGKGDNG